MDWKEARRRCVESGATLFAWTHLSASPRERHFWGIENYTVYKQRIALAQLADTLLAEEVLLLASWDAGMVQVYDAFGPDLGRQLLTMGRIVAVHWPLETKRFGEGVPADGWLSHCLDPEAGLSTLGLLEPRSSKLERSRFIREAIEHGIVLPSTSWTGQLDVARNDVYQAWVKKYGENRIAVPLAFTHLVGCGFSPSRI